VRGMSLAAECFALRWPPPVVYPAQVRASPWTSRPMSAIAPCAGRRADLVSGHMSGETTERSAPTDASYSPKTADSPAGVPWQDSDERRRLGEALRHLLDVVVATGADPDVLAAAAAAVNQLTESLAESALPADNSVDAAYYRSHMSLVGGLSHPAAPQLVMAVDGDTASGEVVVGPLFQGGPGLVHGGIIALLIDHAMGCVAARPDRPAMTAKLTIRYRRPTPLAVPLSVSVRLERIEGRQLHLSASIVAGGEVTVEADGLFLMLTAENLTAVFCR
jgi:acyl-coenzyme A thioesterase PaaI-like protein